MYFDFYDDRPDYLELNRDVARLEELLHLIIAVMVAFFFDIVGVVFLVYLASLPASASAKAVAVGQAVRPEPTRFVFMAPRIDRPAQTAPPNAEASDQNRRAAAPERARNPTNSLPFSRGNTFERIDQPGVDAPPQRMARANPQPPQDGSAQQPNRGQNGQNGQNGFEAQLSPNGRPAMSSARNGNAGAPGMPGPLSAAAANPFRYTRGEAFENPGGAGGEPQAAIQFDSKGVEFGPWLRRFIAQIKRNWLIPLAAMSYKGHVVVTFNVHKDGSITDVQVQEPSAVQAFNGAAAGALVSSNPTQPLPPEYPADRCFFTVTFYYNEQPPYRY
jgi:TonB family protein